MTETTTIRHEVEVDTRIANAFEAYYTARRDFRISLLDVKNAEMRAESHPDRQYLVAEVARLEAVSETYRATMNAAGAAYEEVSKEYTGWSRFYLVKASNGHIHSSMDCSTCFPTTQFGWLVDVSGLSEAEAVAAHGERLCTVCFPSAPSAWTDADSYYARIARETRDERLAERAAKAAAKAAKKAERRLTYHYGVRFVRSDGEVFNRWDDEPGWGWTTLKAARKEVAESGNYNGRYAVIDLDTMEEVQ